MQFSFMDGKKHSNGPTFPQHSPINLCVPISCLVEASIDKGVLGSIPYKTGVYLETHDIQNMHYGWRQGKPYLQTYINAVIDVCAAKKRADNVGKFFKDNPNFIASLSPQLINGQMLFNVVAALHFYTHISALSRDISAFFITNRLIIPYCAQIEHAKQSNLFMLLYTSALYAYEPQTLLLLKALAQKENNFKVVADKIHDTLKATINLPNCTTIYSSIAESLFANNTAAAAQLDFTKLDLLELRILLQVLALNCDFTSSAGNALSKDANFFWLLFGVTHKMCIIFSDVTNRLVTPNGHFSLDITCWQARVEQTAVQQVVHNISFRS